MYIPSLLSGLFPGAIAGLFQQACPSTSLSLCPNQCQSDQIFFFSFLGQGLSA